MADGKPFFPVGIYVYKLNSDIMADLHEQQFNTIVNISGGFEAGQLDYIHQHGLKTIVPSSTEWVKAAKDHPSLLAWYLTDEPEGRGDAAEAERKRYLELKQTDPAHPIGLCHYSFAAIERFKDACDFTMSDVYPVTAARDVPLANVGVHLDEIHRVHGRGFPAWAWIQVFGGPNTDGGKWAVPLPHEVRCMTYIALAHGATGILYFSYWPQAQQTWQSLRPLNAEIHRIYPWLTAPGKELKPASSSADVHVRARDLGNGGIVIAVNTRPLFTTATISLPGQKGRSLTLPFENRTVNLTKDGFTDRFAPCEAHVYTWGDIPPPSAKR
mgnify:FL=1|jgi:hypothetical protein